MSKSINFEVEQLYNDADDSSFLMALGHQDPVEFRAKAVEDCGIRPDDTTIGEEIETPKHGYMRRIPRSGYSDWHEPAKGPGRGAFPVTTAQVYYAAAKDSNAR